jgi:hypothetical protein
MEQIIMKILSNKKIYFILALSAIFLPSSVFASSIYIDTSSTDFYVGDTIMFSVRIDSENKNINAVEGSVLMNYPTDLVSLTGINVSGSKFSLWPGKPLPSESNTSIYFAGGSPGGLNSKDAIVFNIVLKLQQVGQIILTPSNIGVYLNDGKGTKDNASVKNLVIDVLPQKTDSQSVDDWSNLISNDKTPPEPFLIYLGQEGSVFDGRKFLSFSTTDEQSGIAYYEVIEGDLPPVRSNDTYILQEQNESVNVTVIAYDSAGNTRESMYTSPASPNYVVYVVWFVILLFILAFIILLVFIFRKMRKTKNEFTKK